VQKIILLGRHTGMGKAAAMHQERIVGRSLKKINVETDGLVQAAAEQGRA
jgi:hypothetical protein